MTYNLSIEEENKEIARRYKDLLKGAYQTFTDTDKKEIRKAKLIEFDILIIIIVCFFATDLRIFKDSLRDFMKTFVKLCATTLFFCKLRIGFHYRTTFLTRSFFFGIVKLLKMR